MTPYDELATEARAMSAALTEATYDQRFFGMGDVCATVEKAAALLTSIAERLAPAATDPPITCTLSGYQSAVPTASTFKVGDRVRIARRFKTTTSGWAWSPRMDDTLGKCGILDHLVEDVFHVCFEDDQAGWCYAAEALDRLDRNPTRIRMMDTPDGED